MSQDIKRMIIWKYVATCLKIIGVMHQRCVMKLVHSWKHNIPRCTCTSGILKLLYKLPKAKQSWSSIVKDVGLTTYARMGVNVKTANE